MASQAVQVADMVRAVRCCEDHAADFRECEHQGCHRLAQAVLAIGARDAPPRTRDELWLCSGCAERMRRAPSITVNGRRFINDRAGWLIAMPPNVGRGYQPAPARLRASLLPLA